MKFIVTTDVLGVTEVKLADETKRRLFKTVLYSAAAATLAVATVAKANNWNDIPAED